MSAPELLRLPRKQRALSSHVMVFGVGRQAARERPRLEAGGAQILVEHRDRRAGR